ncbi:TonB-linked SusC/RagA family outer membrane protein [Mucilaginibacter auburnensis]|uniref:TonB-linked SusC/RagA family outer membrane protein n=1 Tax=Mucilaginibacter auburnensis TaxID=1457233 RepID=A0A2H9VNW0_9SPHI|nr:TonB-linked SusC/RagA family outer membrane protein [Mucilaginibacter auburnensis]
MFLGTYFSILRAEAQQARDSVQTVTTDSLINVAFRKVPNRDVLGAVSSVNVAELINKSYGANGLNNLQSFVGGYAGGGADGALNIWGQAPLVLIDGIPRRAADVRMTEVESVTVLKDASSVALYGSRAAKGVVLITTKRGAEKPLTVDLRVNGGFLVPKSYPNYLNAADYMTFYNEALRNDGLTNKFTDAEISNTRAGINPWRYPDLNLYSSDFLRKMTYRTDLTGEISGGNKDAKYYSNIGLGYNNNLLKLGQSKKANALDVNVRANVDMRINSWLKASVDAVVIMNNEYTARGDFYGAAATLRPNDDYFSYLVPIDRLDPANAQLQAIAKNSNFVIDGKYLLGGLSTRQTSDLSQILASGYIKTKRNTLMFNAGAEADLGNLTPGLTFGMRFSMDYTSRYSEAFTVAYATYQPTWATVNGTDVITNLTQFGNDGIATAENVGSSLYNQTISFNPRLMYQRTFGQKHNVTGALIGWGYMTQVSSDPNNDGGSDYQNIRNTNLGIQAGYNFNHKYYVDFTGAVIHSGKLPNSNRNSLSPTATLGWRISEEDFFKNHVSFVDDLKLTATYSSLKQDLDITSNGADYYLYQGNITTPGTYGWRDGTSSGSYVLYGRGANPNFTFVERKEFRAGLDAFLFKHALNLNANYFHQETKGLLANGLATVYPSYYNGNGSFQPWLNFNNDMRKGVDFSANYTSKIGKLKFSLGFVGMIYKSEATKRDEVYENSYQNRVGKPLDASFGYIAEGLFQSQAEIDAHARQTFGGTLKPGDIKYKDINGDNVIDTRDQVYLGRNGGGASPFTYGVNLTLKWKNLTMLVLGSGQSGAIGYKNSSYYWVTGLGKYSDVVLNRWTPETASTATYPRLSTNSTTNNFQNSTYWMYDNNRFDLRRVQFTYDFNKTAFGKTSFIHGMSVYVNGDNLLVISKERKLMETNIGSAPQTRFYNIGIKATF